MIKKAIIKEEGGGYTVYSHDGKKKLSRKYSTKAEAVKRLGQIEYFKKQGDGDMNKVANQKQIELCKQAALDRYARYGISGKRAEELYCSFLEKVAETTPDDWNRILAGLGIGAGSGLAISGLDALLSRAGARKEDEEPYEHRQRVAKRLLKGTTIGAGTVGALAALLQAYRIAARPTQGIFVPHEGGIGSVMDDKLNR